MKAEEIFSRLRTLAPQFSFSVSRELVEEGFDCYDVTVTVMTIVEGELVEENAYMGGHYMQEDEPLDDLGGYLPQMLQEAAKELKSQYESEQLNAVIAFLKQEMRDRYDAQRAEIDAQRAAETK